MRPVISFSILLLLFCTASCNHQAAQAPAADTLSFIMAGQSNMAGRGIVAPEDTATDPRLLEMDDAFHYMLKSEPNKLYQGWLAGLDCGHSFGGELLRHLPAQTAVGLIQCSVSSTAMKHWLGDSLGIYTNLVSRARAGAASGPVKGLLWMQGEGDADDAASAAAYGQALSTFIRRLRADAGMPALPFYIALLPRWCAKPYKDGVNAGIRQTAAALSDIHLIPTDDLGMRLDSIHLDAAGQRALGKRFAEAVEEL